MQGKETLQVDLSAVMYELEPRYLKLEIRNLIENFKTEDKEGMV